MSSRPEPTGADAGRERWLGRPLAELRWQAELARLLVDPLFHGVGIPRGDGQPVLLIPGFGAGDPTLLVLARWLRRIGYLPARSGMWANVGCADPATARLEHRLLQLHGRSGRTVALVGHSRGAHFAKALGRRRPKEVGCVISLGAGLDEPLAVSDPTKAGVALASAFHRRRDAERDRLGCMTGKCRCRAYRDYRARFPSRVPLTSIYSRGDGVVDWRSCAVPYAQKVEVSGSHIGLVFNRHAYRAIASALASSRSERAR